MPEYQRVQTELTERTSSERAAGVSARAVLVDTVPAMGEKWDVHLPVFMTAPGVARLLWLDHVYRLALDVPGQVVEFGSQWGASLNVLLMLKLIHEPWNISRVINSFSTFEQGFVDVREQDGDANRNGDYGVSTGWREQLERLLSTHAARSPIGADRNVHIVDGDASLTFPRWLEENPQAIISHAHFDMDVYGPTKTVLEACLPRMPKGACLIFDELNCPPFPGETQAVEEVLGVHSLALRRTPYQPYSAYCVID